MTNLTSSWTDDDGSGTVGTIVNNSQLQTIYTNTGRADNHVVCGRLTLTAGLPVTTADVTGATTIYFSPYLGDVITLYDGSANWVPISFAETSLALGTLTSGLPYDVFGFNNSGSLALELLAWTSTSARATALVLQNGILVKTGATTRRYLGSFYTTSTTQTEDSAVKRFVFNYYNQKPRVLQYSDSTNNWVYSVATWRQARGQAASQVELLQGYLESPLALTLKGTALNDTGGANITFGIGEDSTSAPTAAQNTGDVIIITAGTAGTATAEMRKTPAVGYHKYCWLEASQAVGNTTFYGASGTTAGSNAAAGSGLNGIWFA